MLTQSASSAKGGIDPKTLIGDSNPLIFANNAVVAQLVEQRTRNA